MANSIKLFTGPVYYVTSQKVREHALAHRGAEHPEYVFPKIHNAAHKSSPVSYGISLFPEVI